jgi:hypothetical protein
MLDRIKLAAERKAPARRADKAAAAGLPAPEAEEDDPEPVPEVAGSVVQEEEPLAGVALEEAVDAVAPPPRAPKPDAAASASGGTSRAEGAHPGRRRRRRRHRGRGRTSGTPGQGTPPAR